MSFSPGELKTWLNVTRAFAETENFNKLARIHGDNTQRIHGIDLFLPWHRRFLTIYEEELLKFNPNVILPYIDWPDYSSEPHKHPVLQSNMYGGNGDKNNGWCLTNGAFANLQITAPNRKCLQRRYNRNGNTELSSFSSKEEVQSKIDSNDRYTDFRKAIEGNPHNLPHVYIADSQFDIYQVYSPSDPLFYLHHTFIDNMWYQWQSKKESRFSEYSYDSRNGRKSDQLVYLGGTVGDVLDPRTGSSCYKYEPWGIDLMMALESSPVLENDQNSTTQEENSRSMSLSSQRKSVWDRIRAIPFDKKSDKISNGKQLHRRSTKCLIPKPGKMSPEALKMMNMDPEEYEANRIFSVKVIDILNDNPDYIPAKGC
ncbi:Di-copper centre-containing protein [Conidiobolus coronatus NRRL 28638]|uniref:Di-copper centre-containing protein n=1 Tax=Conidiobolus coronatus (strain ATCC 28846 / CBS 209.66 / NRRL 28638) TaxID=796925 RepID=A0A137PEX7_CONC2|nr:Di-copper centre-containing protein [Conidiobolus coronatus NRRL 28638]|eukprot:KXN73525.1 Di-copper centre-containing protein [Conidiobolus coronatus NRRL 28638]